MQHRPRQFRSRAEPRCLRKALLQECRDRQPRELSALEDPDLILRHVELLFPLPSNGINTIGKDGPSNDSPSPHFCLWELKSEAPSLTLSIFPINVLPWPLSWPPQSSFSKLSWAEVFSGALLPSSSPSLPTEVVSLLPGMTSKSSLPMQGSLPTIRMASHRPSSLNPPCFLFSFPNSPRAQDPTF